ncbi:MAG: monovalent cation/H(+) antiporter subunit G [Rhizobiaceae bacterium]
MMVDLSINLLSWATFIIGGFFLFVGSLGMVRLGDFWARLHAASIIDSAGAGLILLGFMLQAGFTLVSVKIAIIILFLFLTGPTASHAVANAAFVSGSRPKDIVEDVTAKKPRAKPKAATRKLKSISKKRKS